MAEENSWAEWLPQGWTVEVTVRKNGKKDKCYTDPSNGLKFFSKPEVFRYLSHSEFKGKRKHSRKLSAINSPAVAEQIKLADCGTNRQISGDQSSDLAEVEKDEKVLESHAGGAETSASCFNLPEPTDMEQREKSDPVPSVSGLAPVLGAVSENLQENVVENPGSKRKQPGLNKKNKSQLDLPRRASKRLAGIKVGPIPELKTNSRPHRVSARRSNETEVGAAANLGDSAAAPEESADNKWDREDNAETGKKEDGVETGSPLNFTLKDLQMDPCIEFAIKTLTDAIPIGEEIKADENHPGSSLELPLGDSWGDPCIEFAVKTLTGAIPVIGDLGIQDYLHQQLDSSAPPHNGNGSLQNTGGAALHPHCETRS
ncbi:hypothetical protein U1Q18_004485 [Sarracenia purpurea var. burkii]